MSEWWVDNVGTNMLKGVVGDVSNPPRLTSEQIVSFLRRIPEARDSFDRLFPSMLVAEQTRLKLLATGPAQLMQVDTMDISDSFQNKMNRQGVRTTGPRGGRRVGGN